jgi:U2 small nuclear ribonucleoprotein B''
LPLLKAWICFESIDAATNAMAQFQGHPFFDKPIRIAFAKSKSDVVAKRDGSFKPREVKPKKEKIVAEKPSKPVPMDISASKSVPVPPVQVRRFKYLIMSFRC